MFKQLLCRLAFAGSFAAAATLFAVPAASAATVPAASSENWAGYVASGNSTFTRVAGSWVQPSANATSGDGDSAFWVGLGGDSQSGSLEQVGTQADVANGQTIYYAWYELVPSAPVKLSLAIHPGDHISASVAVEWNQRHRIAVRRDDRAVVHHHHADGQPGHVECRMDRRGALGG